MYFYLNWTEKRPSLINILEKKPFDINFIDKFKIKNKEIFICGNISKDFKDYYPPSKIKYKKNQYLSSHLQKCIRRMDEIKTIKTAKHLIDLDLNCFLRRLPIIMLEDVSLHECFPILIWLMIAITKKFKIKYEMIKWLLGVTYNLSKEETKTNYLIQELKEIDWEDNFDEKNKLLIFTLSLRKAYGGMDGDLKMIEYYKHLIANNKINVLNSKIINIKTNIEDLSTKEWIYQANDFHCNKYILKKIKQKHNKYSEDYIKELVWIFSSSINLRGSFIDFDDKKANDWSEIRKTVKHVQKSCTYY